MIVVFRRLQIVWSGLRTVVPYHRWTEWKIVDQYLLQS